MTDTTFMYFDNKQGAERLLSYGNRMKEQNGKAAEEKEKQGD